MIAQNVASTTQNDADSEPVEQIEALMASRLCHDLVSPLGAIGNGLELLEMTPELSALPELALIRDSVEAARARVRVFRIAFGAAQSQRLSAPELAALVKDATTGKRIKVTLDNDADLTRTHAKLIVLGLMCLESALPWGGEIVVCRILEGWRLVANAARVKPDAALWSALAAGEAPRTEPASVHFALLAQAAHHSGYKLRAEIDETGAEIAFTAG